MPPPAKLPLALLLAKPSQRPAAVLATQIPPPAKPQLELLALSNGLARTDSTTSMSSRLPAVVLAVPVVPVRRSHHKRKAPSDEELLEQRRLRRIALEEEEAAAHAAATGKPRMSYPSSGAQVVMAARVKSPHHGPFTNTAAPVADPLMSPASRSAAMLEYAEAAEEDGQELDQDQDEDQEQEAEEDHNDDGSSHDGHGTGMDVLSALVAVASSSALMSASLGSVSSSPQCSPKRRKTDIVKRRRGHLSESTDTQSTESTSSFMPASASAAHTATVTATTPALSHGRTQKARKAAQRRKSGTPEPEEGEEAEEEEEEEEEQQAEEDEQEAEEEPEEQEDEEEEEEEEEASSRRKKRSSSSTVHRRRASTATFTTVSSSTSGGAPLSPPKQRATRHCLPSPLIKNLPRTPLQTLYLQVQKQYTVSMKELASRQYSPSERKALVSVPVRILGSLADLSKLYFVAKDVCLLVFIRKGNVAKSISQFLPSEKARLPVMCPRNNGTSSLHMLTALSVAGVRRLLQASKSPLANRVLDFLLEHLANLLEDAKHPSRKIQTTVTTAINVHACQPPNNKSGGKAATMTSAAAASVTALTLTEHKKQPGRSSNSGRASSAAAAAAAASKSTDVSDGSDSDMSATHRHRRHARSAASALPSDSDSGCDGDERGDDGGKHDAADADADLDLDAPDASSSTGTPPSSHFSMPSSVASSSAASSRRHTPATGTRFLNASTTSPSRSH